MGWTKDNFGMDQLDKGILRSSWTNEQNHEIPSNTELFYLKIKVNESTSLSKLFKLTDEQLNSEAYCGDWNENIETSSLTLLVESTNPDEPPTFEILKVYPNPAIDFVNIEFLLPVESEISWEAYDALGQQVGQGHDFKNAGKVELVLPRRDLGVKGGLRYIKITQKASKRVINVTVMLED